MNCKSRIVFLLFGETGSGKELINNFSLKKTGETLMYWPCIFVFGDRKMMIFNAPDFNSFKNVQDNLLANIFQNTKQLFNELGLGSFNFHILFFSSQNYKEEIQCDILKIFDVEKDKITFISNQEISQFQGIRVKTQNYFELKNNKKSEYIRKLFDTLGINNKTNPQPPASTSLEKIIKLNQKIDIFNFPWYLKLLIEAIKFQNQEQGESSKLLLSIYNRTAECHNCKHLCQMNEKNYKYFIEEVQKLRPSRNSLCKCDFKKQDNLSNQNSENFQGELVDNLNESSKKTPSINKPNSHLQKAQIALQFVKEKGKVISLRKQTPQICQKKKQNIKKRPGSKISALFLFCEDKKKYHIFQSLCGCEITQKIDQKKFNKYFFEQEQIEIIDAPIFTFLDECEENISIFSQFFSNEIIHYIFLFLEYQRIDIMKRRLDSMLKKLLEVDRKQMALIVIGWQNCDREEEDKEMIEQMSRTRNIDRSLFFSDTTNSFSSLKEDMFECMTKNDLERLSFDQTVFAEDLNVIKEPKILFEQNIQQRLVGSLKIKNEENLE